MAPPTVPFSVHTLITSAYPPLPLTTLLQQLEYMFIKLPDTWWKVKYNQGPEPYLKEVESHVSKWVKSGTTNRITAIYFYSTT